MKERVVLVLSCNELFSLNLMPCLMDLEGDYYLAGRDCCHRRLKRSNFFKGFVSIKYSFCDVSKDGLIVQELRYEVERRKITCIIPTDFESLQFLSRVVPLLRDLVAIPPLPSVEQIKNLDDKLYCNAFVKSIGINVPEYKEWSVDKCFDFVDMSFPVVVKGALGAGGESVVVCKTEEAFLSAIGSQNKFHTFVQKYVEGVDYCFYGYAVNGVIRSWAIFRYVELGFKCSKGVFAEFIDDFVVFKNSQIIIEECRYSGPISIDFRKDTLSGIYYFIEINPRFGNNSIYAIFDGINLFHIAIALAEISSVDWNPKCNAVCFCSKKRLFFCPLVGFDASSLYLFYKHALPQILFNLRFAWVFNFF